MVVGIILTYGGMQANKKLELVFVNHTFDVWESWIVEGRHLDNCSLTNSRFRSVSYLHSSISFYFLRAGIVNATLSCSFSV